MSKTAGMLVLFFVFIFGGCGYGRPELLLDEFEGEISSETVDFGSSDDSQIAVAASSENYFCGEQSFKLSYQLNTSGYMWAARGYGLDVEGAGAWLIEPGQIDWNRYRSVSLAMYGQDTGAVYAFDLRDAGGEIWRFLIDDDFYGWKQLILPFEHFFSRGDWQPEEAEVNQVLDFPIVSYQFEPLVPGKREVYFDCIKLTTQLE